MNALLAALWQANVEISLLLLVILFARYAIRKTTKVYNAYLLWLSIPAGLLAAKLVSQIGFSQPPVETVTHIVQNYIVQPAEAFDAWLYPGLLWATVAGLLLLRLLSQHRLLRRDLDRIKVGSANNIRSRYPVTSIDKEDFSPAVYGFFRPVIYFPVQLAEKLSQKQIALIIQHEEHHIKQQHLWLNLLWDILVCCMWFNPLAYISRQNFRHDQELFCDYLVLNKSTKQDHKTYGHALLSTVSATHSVSLLCSWKAFNQLEERIMNIKKPSTLSSKISLAISGLAIIGCASFYSVSAAQHPKHESLHHEVEDDGSSQITLIVDDKTYVDENGQQYMLEGADKRAMTKDEGREFEQAIKNSNMKLKASERQLRTAERQTQQQQQQMQHRELEIERHQADMGRHEQQMQGRAEQLDRQLLELEIQEQQMAQMPQQMETVQREIAQAQKEIERAFKAGGISEQQMRQIQDELSMAKQEMLRDRKHMQRDTQRAKEDMKRAREDMKRAREDTKKARAELQRERANLSTPKPPKAVKAPQENLTPIDPKSPSSELQQPLKPVTPVPVTSNPEPVTAPI